MSRGKADKRRELSSDSEGSEDLVQMDLMNEEEKERFNNMSEKDREIEIFRRLEQRELMKTREQIKRKLELAAGKKAGSSKASKRKKRRISEGSEEGELSGDGAAAKNRGGSSDEEEKQKDDTSEDEDDEDKAAVKSEVDDEADPLDIGYHKPSELANKQNKRKAMEDLLSKRRNKQQAEAKRKKEAKAALDLEEIFGNDEKDDGKSMSSSSSSSSSRSSSPSPRSRTPSPVAQPIQSMADLAKCQVIRRRLARIVHAPFFAKTVIGCFVRVQIGAHDGKATYRIAQITDVVETAKIYEVEPGTEIRTNKGFKLKICNNDTQKVIRLEFVSNGDFTETEYAFWLKRMQETATPLPTVDFVERKQKEFVAALNYKYTDAEINQMVKEKQRFKRNPTNFAFQKAELLKQKEVAVFNGDTELVRDLQQQINDLDEKSKKSETQRNKNLSAVTAINQRNREYRQIFLSTDRIPSSEMQVKDDDPFTRKSARMKMVTGTAKAKLLNAEGQPMSASTSNSSASTNPKTTAASSSLFSIGSAGTSKTLPSIGNGDLFSAHGIDINIDLERVLPATTLAGLRAPPLGGGPIASSSYTQPHSMMASRAPQKSASARTLTLEEYKKKYATRLT